MEYFYIHSNSVQRIDFSVWLVNSTPNYFLLFFPPFSFRLFSCVRANLYFPLISFVRMFPDVCPSSTIAIYKDWSRARMKSKRKGWHVLTIALGIFVYRRGPALPKCCFFAPANPNKTFKMQTIKSNWWAILWIPENTHIKSALGNITHMLRCRCEFVYKVHYPHSHRN